VTFWKDLSGCLPNSSLQVPIICCNDIDAVLHDAINEAIICIRAFVVAPYPFKSRILRNTQSESVFLPKLFQFCKDTVGDYGYALGVQTVHHGRNNFELMLDSM
jgi:hypothetical protein